MAQPRKEVEKQLRVLGFNLLKHGSKHDVWENDSSVVVRVPRGTRVNPRTFQQVLAQAREGGSECNKFKEMKM